MIDKNLCRRLKRLRKASGMTQDQVAQLLNLTRSAYTYYETGKTLPSIRSVIILAQAYGVTTDEILLPRKRQLYLGKEIDVND